MKHLLNLITLVACFCIATNTLSAQDYIELQTEIVTYDLNGGNMNATYYNPTFFTPESLHSHNVSIEPTVSHGLDGIFSNGWEEGFEYDTTQYLHLRVNIADGYIFHLDSVTFTGTGTSLYGPIIGGLVIYDADTLSGSTVGWQICDSVVQCVSSMWYSYPVWDVYPYTWHDTLVNWWQINSSTQLDIRLFAWGNLPDTLGNYMPSTGWIIDNIQLHGKVLLDLSNFSTEVVEVSNNLLPIVTHDGLLNISPYQSGARLRVTSLTGQVIVNRQVYGGEVIELPKNQMILITLERNGKVKTTKVITVG